MKSFKSFLLLEHDANKTWERYGGAIIDKMKQHMSMPYMPSGDINKAARESFEAHSRTADPTPHGEYQQWIAKQYATGGINHFEDIASRTADALDKFHKGKVQRKLKNFGIDPDINRHKSLQHLETAIAEMGDLRSQRQVKDSEATKIDEEHWTIVIPHTENAAKRYGAGTKWCTSADKNCMFDDYHVHGNLHIFIPKKPKYAGEKYQWHPASKQFMDEQDRSIALPSAIFFDKNRPSTHFSRIKNLRDTVFENKGMGFHLDTIDEPGILAHALKHNTNSGDVFGTLYDHYSDHPHPAVRSSFYERKTRGASDNIVDKWSHKWLNDPHHKVREHFFDVGLYRVNPQLRKNYRERGLNDPHPDVRIRAAYSIPSWEPDRTEHLLRMVNDPDQRVRQHITHMLDGTRI